MTALLPATPRGLLRIAGADRARFVHGQTTQDIKRLKPGEGAQALALTPKGKVLAVLLVLAGDDALWIETDADRAPVLKQAWERLIVMDDVTIEDRSAETGIVALSGKDALTFLAGTAGAPLPELAPLAHAPVPLVGHAARIVRACRAGGPGAEVWLPAAFSGAFRATLARAGATEADETALRAVQGMPRYGIEVTEEHLPQEAGFDEDTGWISYAKGCYVGQETVARLHHLGQVQKRLCRISDGGPPRLGYLKRGEAAEDAVARPRMS